MRRYAIQYSRVIPSKGPAPCCGRGCEPAAALHTEELVRNVPMHTGDSVNARKTPSDHEYNQKEDQLREKGPVGPRFQELLQRSNMPCRLTKARINDDCRAVDTAASLCQRSEGSFSNSCPRMRGQRRLRRSIALIRDLHMRNTNHRRAHTIRRKIRLSRINNTSTIKKLTTSLREPSSTFAKQ